MANPRPAVDPVDEGVHADDLAVEVDQRSAGVAGVDRGVGLDVILVVVVRAEFELVAALGADDPGRERVVEVVRHADGAGQFAHAHGVAVGEFLDREVGGFDLDDRDVGFFIRAGQLGRKGAPVFELDGDPVRAGDDVVVGQDVAARLDHEARPSLWGLRRRPPLPPESGVPPPSLSPSGPG